MLVLRYRAETCHNLVFYVVLDFCGCLFNCLYLMFLIPEVIQVLLFHHTLTGFLMVEQGIAPCYHSLLLAGIVNLHQLAKDR